MDMFSGGFLYSLSTKCRWPRGYMVVMKTVKQIPIFEIYLVARHDINFKKSSIWYSSN